MIEPSLYDHPGWQWCTSEGAELHTLLMGLTSTFPEKLAWLEEAENLTISMAGGHEKFRQTDSIQGGPVPNPSPLHPSPASSSPASRESDG
jgi:hypothetical protein